MSGPPTGPLTDEERYRFDLQGFLVRRGALHGEELAAAQAAVAALGYPPPGDELHTQRFHDHLGRASIFRDLLDHPAVLDVLVALCGTDVRLDHHYGIVMAPGTSGLWLHGGGTPFDPSQSYLVRDGEPHCGLVVAAWSLVDAPPGSGGFACVPGSHKASFVRPPSVDYGHDLVREVPLAAGDLLVFTEALTHGTLPWRAAHERRLLFYKYSPGHMSWGNEANGGVGPTVLASMTERQQRLCQAPSVAYHRPVVGGED